MIYICEVGRWSVNEEQAGWRREKRVAGIAEQKENSGEALSEPSRDGGSDSGPVNCQESLEEFTSGRFGKGIRLHEVLDT